MENIEKIKIAGIPVLFAAIIGVVAYLLNHSAGPVRTDTVKANTAGSGLPNTQQAGVTGVVATPDAGSANTAIVNAAPDANAYWLYNVQSDLNASLPPANAPTANPLKSAAATTSPGNPNAYPWTPDSSDPNNANGSSAESIYAVSQSDQINSLVSNYGDIFTKSLFAMAQAGYLNLPSGNN